MGHRNRLLLFAALLVVATFLSLSSFGELPERVAIHFDTNGAADGWMSRGSYRLAILVGLVGLPSFLVWGMAGLPRLTKGSGQVPNNEYWFAPERRHATESYLLSHACWLGCMTVAIVYGMHVLILRANAMSPPLFATDRFVLMLLIYLCGLGWWFMTFLRHFQRTDRHN
jgi:uncharacterized membrane protein